MDLTGSYGIVLTDADMPSLPDVQREIERMPCLFSPTLLVMQQGDLACRIRMRDRDFPFGYCTAIAADVIAPAHKLSAGRWQRALVFRDDGTTIGASLSAMVGEAVARSSGGTLYDRDRGLLPDHGDLVHFLDCCLAAEFGDWEPYYAKYPEERPSPRQAEQAVRIEAKVFWGAPS